MALTETPTAAFGTKAPDFDLPDCFGDHVTRDSIAGKSGLLVIFMCNHCPYVQALLPRFNDEIKKIQALGVGCIAINSNDISRYPDDSPSKMKELSEHYQFSFPYCFDETQAVAKAYGAVCTPDFFGYNSNLELQYRGRFDSALRNPVDAQTQHELLEAMTLIAKTGNGPQKQQASIGCSIKWRSET